jgi:hypothetical protein
MEQNIADYQIAGPVAKKIQIIIEELVLNSHAQITVSFLDENDGVVDNKYLKMEGTDYDGWGTDDNYVKTWVLAQLGLTTA